MSDCLDSKQEEELLRLRKQQAHQARTRWLRMMREGRMRFQALTGPLTQPRSQYYDVLTAADLAGVEKRRLNQVICRGQLPFEQPAPRKKYILKSVFREWMEEQGLG
jgi:hypothetical protein